MTTDEIKVADAGTADKIKLVVAVLLAIGGVAGYYVLGASPPWQRWLAVAAGLVLGVLVVAFSRYGSEFKQFLELARVELRKIVWPTRSETLTMTFVVFAFVAIAGIFFWLLDLVLAWATKTITGTGS
jgi:preprotein translocase subunit SecE